MIVARRRFIAADKNRSPRLYMPGDEVADFSSWPVTAREGAIGTGQVEDMDQRGRDADDPPGVAGHMKRLWWRMMGHKQGFVMNGPTAMPKQRISPAQGSAVSASADGKILSNENQVEHKGFACDVCAKIMPTLRGMKIHRATQHRGV